MATATTLRRFKSKSSPGTWHKVQTANPTAKRPTLTCTCLGYRFTKHCWHVAKVQGAK